MIIKSISTRNSSALIKYIFREQTVSRAVYGRYITDLQNKYELGIPLYIAGQRVSKEQLTFLIAEYDDKALAKEFKKFEGTLQQFVSERLMNGFPSFDPRLVRSPNPFVLTKNLRGRSVAAFCKEFDEVNGRRQHRRADQIQATHFILSFHKDESALLTDSKLKAMAKEFIRLLGDNHVSCIAKHEDKGHATHLHMAVCQTLLDSRGFRLSKEKFAAAKDAMTRFQTLHFPELTQSLPQHGLKRNSQEVQKIKKSNDRSYIKNNLIEILDVTYKNASSKQHFLSQLQGLGITTYERTHGVETGLVYQGLKFRYSRLENFSLEALNKLDAKAKSLAHLKDLSDLRTRSRDRQPGRAITPGKVVNGHAPLTQEIALQELAAVRARAQEVSIDADREIESAPAMNNDLDDDSKRPQDENASHEPEQKEEDDHLDTDTELEM